MNTINDKKATIPTATELPIWELDLQQPSKQRHKVALLQTLYQATEHAPKREVPQKTIIAQLIEVWGRLSMKKLRLIPQAERKLRTAISECMGWEHYGLPLLTQAPHALVAMEFLTCIPAVAQGLHEVRLPTDQNRPLPLMLLADAKSGERKTAVHNRVSAAIYDFHQSNKRVSRSISKGVA